MIFWKMVFWLYLAATGIYYIYFPFSSGLPFSQDYTIIQIGWDVIALLSLIPLYGYAYQFKIGNKILSIAIFVLSGIEVLLASVLGFFVFMYRFNIEGILYIILCITFSFIFLYPQYRYAFYSRNIWENKKNA